MGPNLYFVFIGIFQFLNDFQGLRGRPNCKIFYDPSKGFNEGCLSLVALSKNGAGIGADTELLLAYPSSYDHDRSYEVKDSYAARFKGPMAKFVQIAPSPGKVGDEVDPFQEVTEPLAKRPKLESDVSGATPTAAASSSGGNGLLQPPGTSPPPGTSGTSPPPGKAVPSGTSPPGEVTLYSFDTPFKVEFKKVGEGDNVSYQWKSLETINKRLPRHFVLATFTDGKLKETPLKSVLSPNQYPFEVDPSTLVMDMKTQNIDTLAKIFKEHFPKAMKLLGYEKFEKVGQMKAKNFKADQSWVIEFPGEKGQSTVALLRSFASYKSIAPLWGLIYDEKDRFFHRHLWGGRWGTATRQTPQKNEKCKVKKHLKDKRIKNFKKQFV